MILFVLILFSIFVFAFYSLYKIIILSTNIHDRLNKLKEKVKSSKNKEELQFLWLELIELNKECWHKSFSPKVIEIKTIIETKFELL